MEHAKNPKPPEAQEPTPGPSEPTLVPMNVMERARKPRQVVLRDPDSNGADEVVPLDALLVEALAAGPATLIAPLLAALSSGQYFITLTWRCKPHPPDDLLHSWEHRGLAETDVIPALQFHARDFGAKKIAHLQRQSGPGQGWS